MMPETGAEMPRISITVSSAFPPVNSTADRASASTTPVFTRAPTMMNSPAKNSSVSPLDAGQIIGSLQFGDQDQDSGAQQGHDGGLDMQH
jgi:hypothetical protein